MDNVIVEELLRSLTIYFLVYILIILLGSQFYHEPTISLYVIVGIPLITAVSVFSIFVYKRKTTGKNYMLRRGSIQYKAMMVTTLFVCFALIISRGVKSISEGNSLIGLLWICLAIISGASAIKELGRKQ